MINQMNMKFWQYIPVCSKDTLSMQENLVKKLNQNQGHNITAKSVLAEEKVLQTPENSLDVKFLSTRRISKKIK